MQPIFKDQFLIAMPQLADPHFEQTVTWLMEHTEDGAFGLTINRPSSLSFKDIARDLGITCRGHREPPAVLWGGPVQQEIGFVLHRDDGQTWNNSRAVAGDILLTTSRDIIESLAEDKGPEQAVLILGYSSWGGGQLEQEMLDNTWLSVPAQPHLLFGVPVHERWLQAGHSLGVDIRLMSQAAGHA